MFLGKVVDCQSLGLAIVLVRSSGPGNLNLRNLNPNPTCGSAEHVWHRYWWVDTKVGNCNADRTELEDKKLYFSHFLPLFTLLFMIFLLAVGVTYLEHKWEVRKSPPLASNGWGFDRTTFHAVQIASNYVYCSCT